MTDARTVHLGYVPTARQRLFHASGAQEVFFGGAAGGGKSRALVMEALARCLQYPGTQAYLFRRTYRELDETLLREARACIPEALGRYRAATHDWPLVNGSVLRFRHCQRDADRFSYQGAEIQHLCIDELSAFPREVYNSSRPGCARPKACAAP